MEGLRRQGNQNRSYLGVNPPVTIITIVAPAQAGATAFFAERGGLGMMEGESALPLNP